MTATSQHTASVELTVGQVAQTFGVTVRTLHHYDAQGLVVPSARTHSGYRLYTDADLSRLAVVVTYRRLGLPLTQVRALLDGEGSAAEHLRRQRDAVLTRRGRAHRPRHGHRRSTGGRDERPTRDDRGAQGPVRRRLLRGVRQAEAEERWGETDAWQQSAARTRRYTPADWERIKAEMDAVNAALVAALHLGRRAGLRRGHGCGGGPPGAHRTVVLRPRPPRPPWAGRHVPRRPAVHEDATRTRLRASRSTCTTPSTPTRTGTPPPEPVERRQIAVGGLPPAASCLLSTGPAAGVVVLA